MAGRPELGGWAVGRNIFMDAHSSCAAAVRIHGLIPQI